MAATLTLSNASRHRQEATRYVWRVVAIAAAVALWHVFSLTPLGQQGQVPSPFTAVGRLFEMWLTGAYWGAVGSTLLSFAIGLFLSIIIGVPLGLLIGSSKRVTQSTQVLIDFVRTIPAIALLPISLLVFGVDKDTSIFLIFMSAVWPLIIQASYAAAQIDPALKQVKASFHLSWWLYLRFQFLPSALPFISTGLRIAAVICLLTAISAEFLGGIPGIGQQLQAGLASSQPPTVYAWVLTAGLLGVLLNVGLLYLQRMMLSWHPSVRGDSR